MMALALAPLWLLLQNQLFHPTVNGRMRIVTVPVFEVTGQPVTVRQEIIHGVASGDLGIR